jgi:hypothetical protein
MSELSQLAVELGDFCAKRSWRFCVIGGFAVQHWGEPRMTMDVDLSLLTWFGEEEIFVDELLRASDFCLLRCGPVQASALRSEASRALSAGDKNRRLVPKGD